MEELLDIVHDLLLEVRRVRSEQSAPRNRLFHVGYVVPDCRGEVLNEQLIDTVCVGLCNRSMSFEFLSGRLTR
jgi:hypothetical protein